MVELVKPIIVTNGPELLQGGLQGYIFPIIMMINCQDIQTSLGFGLQSRKLVFQGLANGYLIRQDKVAGGKNRLIGSDLPFQSFFIFPNPELPAKLLKWI